jgi:hypothetical protein
MNINILNKAVKYYNVFKFIEINVPYIVDEAISNRTKPKDRQNIFHYFHEQNYSEVDPNRVYVASAEQSFIQLYKEGKLQIGRWMGLSPCLRDEPILDDLHYKMFLKLELIYIGSDDVNFMVEMARSFFIEHLNLKVEKIKTKEGVDLFYKNIELGSYGTRTMPDGLIYTYGTGLAEPRTSICLEKNLMKDYSIYTMKCDCSKRMRIYGKTVKIFNDLAIRKCPNCGKLIYIRRKK